MGQEGIRLAPPMEVVRELEPVPRERIYRHMARTQEMGPYLYPYCGGKRNFQEWFAGCDLPEDKLQMISRMAYLRAGFICLSDVDYLAMTLPREEMKRVSRTLSRVSSLLLRVKVTPESDVDRLLAYWGTSSRAEKTLPLLESIRRLPEGSELNVSWFFPSVPRQLVYSYPDPKECGTNAPDCVWTCMNFFNEIPDNRFYDNRFFAQVLKAEYHKVPKPELFQPWVLTRLKEVLNLYATVPHEAAVFRKNTR
jgi:hypothetical protein